ncbi:MAG: extracellular solute-binding protein [Clostridia bacterium]|nr:extracellular solute-binding protein [Clostridia bacterium]
MKLRRIAAGLMVLLLILSVLTGCGLIGQDEPEGDPYRYIYFYYPRDGNQILKRLILKYNETQEQQYQQMRTQNPEEKEIQKPIRIVGLEGSGNRSQFFERLDGLRKDGETVPDLILVHDTWLEKMIAEDTILPLDGGLSDSKKSELFQGMTQAVTYNNKTYAVPFWQDLPLLYYRKDLMETPPVSWTELAQIANRISEAQDMEYGLVFPGASQENNAIFLSSVWSYFGAQLDFSEKELSFDEDAMSAAWTPLISMVKEGTLPPDVLSMSSEDCRAVFEAGNAVFMWNWSYAGRLFQRDESLISDKAGISSLPVSDHGGRVTSGYVLTMSKSSSLMPEAWNFMQYLLSDKSQRQLMDTGLLPAKKSLYQAGWLRRNGLSSDIPVMLDSGQAVKVGNYTEAAFTMMNQLSSMAFSQNKNTKELIRFIKEGIVTEEPIEDEDESPVEVDEEPDQPEE